MFKFFKKDEPEVMFESVNYAVRKYAPIRPAAEFVPEKFKKLPTKLKSGDHRIDDIFSIKVCPGLQDYMGMGWVIPAWCDIEITPQGSDFPLVRYSEPTMKQGFHHQEQLGDFLDTKFKNRHAVKLDNPWLTYAKDGWSCMYLPMSYHENQGFYALPGVIDHDKGALQSPINIMISTDEKFVIKQGTPIVQVVPFKRQVVTARTGDVREKTKKRFDAIRTLHSMTFKGWRKLISDAKRFKVDAHDTEL